MKIMCFTYRDWAKKIYSNLDNEFKGSIDFIHINSKDEYSEETINKENPDLILWYGWSWIIPSSITNNLIDQSHFLTF